MKPGFSPGITAEARFVVDETMLAAFEGRVVHRVLGTAALVAWLEWAGRKLILPYLEDDAEGVGHAIDVTHRSPALLGSSVVARATLVAHRGNRVVCRVEAHAEDGRLIADGEFTQVILPREVVARRFGGEPPARTG
jgi:predicted thioesterase